MPSSHRGLPWIALVLAAGLGFSQPAGDARGRTHSDLDDLTDAQLMYYLTGELDDIYLNRGGPNAVVPACTLYRELMVAISDEGDSDDDDAADDFIDDSELAEEMREASTSVADEIEDAVGEQCGGGGSDAGSHGPRVHGESYDGTGLPPMPRKKAVPAAATQILQSVRAKG